MSGVLIPLALCAFIVNLGYGIVIPVLPTLVATSATGVGIFYGVFSATKLVSQVAGGVLADRRGAVFVLMGAVILYSCSLAGIAAAGDANAITAWRALEGVAVGLSYPCVSAIVLGASTREHFARNHGAVLGVAGAGMVLGPVSATLVGAAAVRPLLFSVAAAAVLSTLPLFVLARRSQHVPSEGGLRTLFDLLRAPAFLLLLPALAFSKLAFSIMQPLIPVRGAALALDGRWIGALFGANGVLFAAMQPPAAWCIRRFGARRTALVALCVAVSATACLGFNDQRSFIVATLVYASAGGFVFGASTALVGERYHADRSNHAKVFAAMHMASDACMIIAPVLFMWSYGDAPVLAFAGLTAVGVGLALVFATTS